MSKFHKFLYANISNFFDKIMQAVLGQEKKRKQIKPKKKKQKKQNKNRKNKKTKKPKKNLVVFSLATDPCQKIKLKTVLSRIKI